MTTASSSGSSAPIDRSTRLVDLLAALPDLLTAGLFLAFWIDPARFPPDMLGYLVLLMLLEFIVVHSAGFMGSVAIGAIEVRQMLKYGRGVGILGLGLLYSLFVLGFCLSFETWWPMAAFWGLVANRLLGALIGQGETDEETKRLIQGGWGVSVMAYLVGAFATLIWAPRLGITASVVDMADLPGGGLWIEEPWRPVAFGVIYFALVGWYELRWRRWGGVMPAASAT